MKTNEIKVTAHEITDTPGLDPVRVIIQDIGPGQGRVIIECFGRAWGCYWPAMGGKTVSEFIIMCDVDYLVNALSYSRPTKSDYAYFSRIVKAVKESLSTQS